MQVILLEKVRKLGNLGDQVRVRAGFGRNYLIPQGKAVPATPENVATFEAQRQELEKAQADSLAAATARAEQLAGLSVTVAAKTGEEGRLYGSVGTVDIAEAVTRAGVEISKHEVRLPNGPFRVAGEYEVTLNLHADVDAQIKLSIVPEEG